MDTQIMCAVLFPYNMRTVPNPLKHSGNYMCYLL